MVRLVLLLLLFCFLWTAADAQQPPSPLPTTLIAREGSGSLWGAADNTDGIVFRWQHSAWQAFAMPETKGFMPRTMTHGDDGAVYILWQTQNQNPAEVLVSVHRGGLSRILARFPNIGDNGWQPIQPLPLWAGSGGDVWVAGSKQNLWHISYAGAMTVLPNHDVLFRDGRSIGWPWSVQMSSLVDGQGRRWFWQTDSFWGAGLMRGVMIWDGTHMDYHASLPGLPDQPFSLLANLDKNHLWVSLLPSFANRSPEQPSTLFRLDTGTLEATPATMPGDTFDKFALHDVAQMFQANGYWYTVISSIVNQRQTQLWRTHGESEPWRKCLNVVEDKPGNTPGYESLPWQDTSLGVWLGVIGGAWWIPAKDGPAVFVNWRRGLVLTTISHFFPLSGGRVLATGSGGDVAAILPPAPGPLLPLPKGMTGENGSIREGIWILTADKRGHLWSAGTIRSSTFPLDEWDGTCWHTHYAPKTAAQIDGLFASDTQGRIWLNSTVWNPPAVPISGVIIYDPARNNWTTNATPAEALAGSASLPGVTLLPIHNVSLPLALSGDGRAAYADDKTVGLYEGHTWRRWTYTEIDPTHGLTFLTASPQLTSAGTVHTLKVECNGEIWQWTDNGGWVKLAVAPYQPPLPLPPGGPAGLITWQYSFDQIPSDNTGAKWLNWQGSVYKIWHGLWAKQPELSQPGSPFEDGRRINQISTDKHGRLFFLTVPGQYNALVPWLPPFMHSLAPPQIRVMPRAIDAVTLRFINVTHIPHQTTWRVNGGEWKKVPADKAVDLFGLTQGDYRVEAQTMDTLLQTSPQPSAAVFSIRPASANQIAGWVRILLTGSDDARNRAANDLIKQSDPALPAIEAARPGANELGEWWLDAVMQQIQGQDLKDTVSTMVH